VRARYARSGRVRASLGDGETTHQRVSDDGLHALATDNSDSPVLRSFSALVLEQKSGRVIFAKNIDAVQPIASLTKLMTAIVVLEARQPYDEALTIDEDDVDWNRRSRSKLKVGTAVTRIDLLRLALLASENRAAAALGRSFPGGLASFVSRMNEQAARIGMRHTHFADATGLSTENTSNALDLAILVQTAYRYEIIRAFTTTSEVVMTLPDSGQQIIFHNTNLLVRHGDWDIGLSKTGYINESGHCLLMLARILAKPMVIVLLDSWGHNSRIGDARRIRRWIEESQQASPGDS
jgi:serine-type D-Ala-D-Ala endopeptidase (penicillin-binding protein 7)